VFRECLEAKETIKGWMSAIECRQRGCSSVQWQTFHWIGLAASRAARLTKT